MPRRRRAMPQTPLQVVSCLIFDKNDWLLLLRRHSQDLGGGLWAAPGGTRGSTESAETALIREIMEETGLKLTAAQYLGKHELRMPHGTAQIATFKTHITGNEVIIIDPFEHERYRWFNTNELSKAEGIIWGLPTTLRDFKLIKPFGQDPTLSDGSQAILLDAPPEQ